MSYFSYGSHQIYYESHGEGKPLILLHGNTASCRMFDPIIPLLAGKYHVVIGRICIKVVEPLRQFLYVHLAVV